MKYFGKLNNKGGLEILIILAVVAGGIALAGGYIGVIPQISSVLKTNTPRNLNVSNEDTDINKIRQKIGTSVTTIKAKDDISKTLVFEGQKSTTYTLSNTELTTLLNSSPWKYYPFSEIQVKIGKDGIVEASGMFEAQKVLGLLKEINLKTEVVSTIINNYKDLNIKLPIYIKGTGSVETGVVTLNITNIEVGRLPLPQQTVDQITPKLKDISELVITAIPGFSVKSLTFKDAQMNFSGTIPEKVIVATD